MDASVKVTLIVLLLIGLALIVVAMLMPRIAPMWTIQNSPFVGQVVAALARFGPPKTVGLASPDYEQVAIRFEIVEQRIGRGDFDGAERKLESISKHDRDEVVHVWADLFLYLLHERTARAAGVHSP